MNNRDKFIELAKQSGFKIFKGRVVAADGDISGEATQSLQNFYELVRRNTLEDASYLCTRFYERDMNAAECASAIKLI